MSTMLAEGDDLSGAEKVFAFFRDALLDGSLKPGERLLGERELLLRLGVSRPLLREALRSLAMLGFPGHPPRQGRRRRARVRHQGLATAPVGYRETVTAARLDNSRHSLQYL
jgi:DNA-binding FadR family transcriptional regulator